MPIHTTHPDSGEPITVGIKETSFVISPRYGESYSFDRAGRLIGFFYQGRSYQRALDGRLVERRKVTERPRRRTLPPAERDRLLGRVFGQMQALADALPRMKLAPDDRARFADVLRRALDFGPERLARDGAAFRALYKPVSILPPDQYLALVLQATEGCTWNKCTFCGLYRDRAFHVRSAEAFREHCARVRDFFGEALALRRGIFLADANALVLGMARLRAIFAIAQEYFRLPDGPRPAYSFVSAFDVGHKSAEEWAELHALGLQRAYIGLETGDDALLRFLNKPGSVQDAVDAVHELRAGGVAVGVILMAGIGGDRYAAEHVAHSVEAIRTMALGPRDQVYLSTYVPAPHTEYEALAEAAGIRALSEAEVREQLRALQSGVRAVAPQTPVAPYQVEGFAF